MLWINDPNKWQKQSDIEKLKLLRQHYCTGPCGQSNHILATRSATDSCLSDTIKIVQAYQFAFSVLKFFEEHDIIGMLYWHCKDKLEAIKFALNTNDLFVWGSADAEAITEDNFELLKKSVQECVAIDPVLGEINGCELFACRMNKMRPQGAAYPENKNLWPLFDACGPEREISLGNPYKPGDYKTGS